MFLRSLVVLSLVLTSASAMAQTAVIPYFKTTNGGMTPVTTLSPLPSGVYTGALVTPGFVLTANAPGALATFQAAGGGSIAFSSLTGGTNTNAAMLVGTGASLGTTGSGTIQATTNANLTGPITSVGNATSIAAQTGTGTTFAMSAGPTFTGTLAAAIANLSGKLTTETSGTTNAPINIPPGSAPTSPANGDLWTTASGVFAQVAGATVGPFGTGGGGTTTIIPPQGRLTLTTGVPVMIADVAAGTTLFYAAYNGGNKVPSYNGSTDSLVAIPGNQVSTAMAATGTGVLNASGVFDVWWFNSTICVATNGTGGGWASDTGGSNTARGTGYSQLDTSTRAFITNKNAIASCYNGVTNEGSISANQATYLGTIMTTAAAGTVAMQFQPSGAAGGSNNMLGVYNAYNRVVTTTRELDTTSSWTYQTNTWRPEDGSSSNVKNRVTYVDGLGQSSVLEINNINVSGAGLAYTGAVEDSTTAAPLGQCTDQIGSTNGINFGCQANFQPAIGLHFIQIMEDAFTSNATTYATTCNSGNPCMGNYVTLEM